jgi:hypothetical protein
MAVSYGDATVASVGTVTSVCGDTLLAFGHPWSMTGAVTASANAVSVAYVQPDSVNGPYTIANVGGSVGTVVQDSLLGLRVRVGPTEPGTVITSQVMDRTTGVSRRGVTVAYELQSSLAYSAYNHLYQNLVTLPGDDGPSSVTVDWTLHGTAGDRTFELRRSNRFSEISYAKDAAAWELAMILDALVWSNPFVEVKVSSIDITATVDRGYDADRIVGLQVDRGSGFAPVPFAEIVTVDPGSTVSMRVDLLPYRSSQVRSVDVQLTVPADAAGQAGTIDVFGGSGSGWIDPSAVDSFDALLAMLAGLPRNDDLTATMGFQAHDPVSLTTRLDRVVSGSAHLDIQVRGGTDGGEEPVPVPAG